MSISQSRYISITSGVAGASALPEKKLILRIITQSSQIPAGTVVEYQKGSLSSIASTFGINSEEYKRAVQYFSFVSKDITSPQLISYYGWTATGAAPQIVGGNISAALSFFQGVTAGELIFNIGTSPVVTVNVTGIDLSAATSLTDVASALTTAINAETNPQLASGSFFYDSVNNRIVFTGGVIAETSIKLIEDTGSLATSLAMIAPNAENVDGILAQTAEQAVAKSVDISNNFGSFLFAGNNLTLPDITAVAAWNNAQNNQFLYTVPVKVSDASAYKDALIGFAGTSLTAVLDDQTGYPEQIPAEIAAATDYNGTGIASQNYMFQQSSLAAVVKDDILADTLDNLRVNYVGQTQEAGVKVALYQRGLLMGGLTSAVDQNTYVNEIWLKSSITSSILNALIASRMPANAVGTSAVLGIVQGVVNQALVNGVISVGKTLTNTQKVSITDITNNANAWRNVQINGYYLTASISQSVAQSGVTEYTIDYLLVYAKDDQVRKVNGRDVLI